MRTTVTLDADTEALVRRLMAERGVSFKRALNDAIRAGDPSKAPKRGRITRTRRMGAAAVDLDRALSLAGTLEDDELIRRLQVGT
ncbi:antitoxin [Pseudactinotalea sp. HY158]|uniref:antitoxin n=1 Tax=Pseudactinotalea sp. HY158 TaxID=2654547 RepID=UPI00129D08B6|nr:antitoxin [Pseudactinotalea sp. HY158]QGH69418.1 antitoxin [Pseudactinotalea sp. HY158]